MKHTIEDQAVVDTVRQYLEMSGIDVPDGPIAVTFPGAGKVPQKCASGSGLMTKGGKFAPGFDAKLKSALYAIVLGKPEKVPEELKEHGPEYVPVSDWTVEKAKQALRRHNWPDPTPPKPKAVKAPKDETVTEGESEAAPAKTRTTSTKKGRREAAADATV